MSDDHDETRNETATTSPRRGREPEPRDWNASGDPASGDPRGILVRPSVVVPPQLSMNNALPADPYTEELQAAAPSLRRIVAFRGTERFLSNFYPSPVLTVFNFEVGMEVVKGVVKAPYGWAPPTVAICRTVEHGYQAMKMTDMNAFTRIAVAPSPGTAKTWGRAKTYLRVDWEHIKEHAMMFLLRQKFADPLLRYQLLKTEPSELVEGNYWNDTYWGVCDGVGQNRLGQLLMILRRELWAETKGVR